jgi:putative endopeptidase
MAHALSMIFVERAFSAQSKARMREMVANIKGALAERLRALEWMSEETRARALDKLSAMGVKIGYPDKWRDFSDADVGSYSYVENWMRAKAFFVRRDVARVGKPVDRSDWFMAPHIVNAQYNASGNEIIFPAGILQPPFFDPKADDAVNYGGIGVVIGHEMTHGFDDGGSKYDQAGNLRDWWTASDATQYKQRVDRIIAQYDAYTVLDSLHVNGRLTTGENMSDLGGLTVSYAALQKALQNKKVGLIDGFTPEQRFFLSYARIWRQIIRPEEQRRRIATDPHSPGQWRANGPISNMPQFYQAFGCKSGDPMMRPEDTRTTIW